ncbi:uncharacterized protein LOC116247153 isoform X2 [Nymphaea colorata]|uniref:uncharacterized protein LOC116247153 isoform X2 n=1 Tax=Nymphaea colorata TaxID=210225 RepID=UPI00214F36C8|nr:uncharacterized protein LOC116247153 isoform X2 [Nymphaea colorata]
MISDCRTVHRESGDFFRAGPDGFFFSFFFPRDGRRQKQRLLQSTDCGVAGEEDGCLWEDNAMGIKAPSLQDFIMRARVLKLYRDALRTARRAPPHSRDELKQAMRQEMEKNRNCHDRQRIRFLISEGTQRLRDLDQMLDMQGHSQ